MIDDKQLIAEYQKLSGNEGGFAENVIAKHGRAKLQVFIDMVNYHACAMQYDYDQIMDFCAGAEEMYEVLT